MADGFEIMCFGLKHGKFSWDRLCFPTLIFGTEIFSTAMTAQMLVLATQPIYAYGEGFLNVKDF